jgi:hypothetical protein
MAIPRVRGECGEERGQVDGNRQQDMRALVLLNSMSPGYAEGRELILPHLDHLGVPCELLDLASTPLPPDVADYALIFIAHRALDPRGSRLGRTGRGALLAAVKAGSGLVSFDPLLPSPEEIGLGRPDRVSRVEVKDPLQRAEAVEFAPKPHFITGRHARGEVLPLVGPLAKIPRMAATQSRAVDGKNGTTLLRVAGAPLLSVRRYGDGRVVLWATARWLRTDVLGPMAGLDDVLWRSLVWAARKPFAMRGLPPLVTMRVDDVAGRGGLWGQSPLYWACVANRYGFKPWLGLFIYNLTETAVDQVRELIGRGQATAFPHALGRPPRAGEDPLHYYPHALSSRASSYDEFIFFDHERRRPWSDVEAVRGLTAVDEWYAAHAPLPISAYAIAHWYEMGSNVISHVQDRFGAQFIAMINDVDRPLMGRERWLRSGPFRRYERPGGCFPDRSRRSGRPVYYADFVNLAGYRFFNCVTEIRDDAGYEWKPDNDMGGTIGRGVRQLRRALDSMALAVLFTHETDHIHKIQPDVWATEIAGVAAGIAGYDPIYVTSDDAVRYVRATRTSHLRACHYDPTTGQVIASVVGHSDVLTHFHLFGEVGDEMTVTLVEIPPHAGDTIIQHQIRRT